MTEKEMFPEHLVSSGAEVMVAIWNEDSLDESVKLAQFLRRAGLRVDLYPEPDKLGKQFKYAAARAIPFVALLGDEERAQGKVALKNMTSGEQQAVLAHDVADLVRRIGY
jgi:histidyl-tRNA synthetase